MIYCEYRLIPNGIIVVQEETFMQNITKTELLSYPLVSYGLGL